MPAAVPELIQTNLAFAIALIVVPLLFAFRAAIAHAGSKKDLTGAIWLFTAFFVLRGVSWLLPATTESYAKAITVAWSLAFAFALIRTVVSLTIVLMRLRTGRDIPKILRDVVDFSLYAMAGITIIKTQLAVDLTGLLATSAILSVVLGLALQDTLGNLFAGLALQFERPYEIGDWIIVEGIAGRVMQVAWRSIKIETTRGEVITLPNSVVSKHSLRKVTRAQHTAAAELMIEVSYDAPPNRVKRVVLDVLGEIDGVLSEPPTQCFVNGFQENGVRYRIRYYVKDYPQIDRLADELYSRLWYRLRREGMEIPYPQRTLYLRQEEPRSQREELNLPELLKSVDILSLLADEERKHLATELRPRRFGRGEEIIEQGEAGQSFYVVAEGRVSVRAGTPPVEVTRLERGQYFGEMALLTGEPRTATVVALEDVLLFALDRKSFARLFQGHPELAREMSKLLAHRRSQLRSALAAAEHHADDTSPEAGRILTRLRSIFGLKGE